MTTRYGTAEKLAQLGVRKEVERSGILRAIEIEGVDLQPCGGTHVKRTAQIGMILVRKCSKIRQDWRLEFVCGRRAERVAREDARRLRHVAENLGCAPDDVVAAAERAVTEREAHFRNAKTTLQRLADLEAEATLQHSAECERIASGQAIVSGGYAAGISFTLFHGAGERGEGHCIAGENSMRAPDFCAAFVGREGYECFVEAGFGAIRRERRRLAGRGEREAE